MHYDNYDSDYRVRASRHPQPEFRENKAFVRLFTDDDEEYEYGFPAKWEVCPTCNGKGSHVNPSIDCNGLSAEDFAEDPDFAEEYMRGSYDVQCYNCNGRTTTLVIDQESFSDEDQKHHKRWEAYLDDYYETQRIYEAERRMGA